MNYTVVVHPSPPACYFVPVTTSISQGPVNPSGPSNCASASPISAQASSRWSSGSPDEHLVQRAEGLLLEPDALGGGRHPHRRLDDVHGDVAEPAVASASSATPGPAEAERSRLAGQRRRQLRAPPDDADRDREEPVAVGRRVHDRRQPAARAERGRTCRAGPPAGPGSRSGRRARSPRRTPRPRRRGARRRAPGWRRCRARVAAAVRRRTRGWRARCRSPARGRSGPTRSRGGQRLAAGAGGHVEHAGARRRLRPGRAWSRSPRPASPRWPGPSGARPRRPPPTGSRVVRLYAAASNVMVMVSSCDRGGADTRYAPEIAAGPPERRLAPAAGAGQRRQCRGGGVRRAFRAAGQAGRRTPRRRRCGAGPRRPRPGWSWSPVRRASARPRCCAVRRRGRAGRRHGRLGDLLGRGTRRRAWWPWTEALRGADRAPAGARRPGRARRRCSSAGRRRRARADGAGRPAGGSGSSTPSATLLARAAGGRQRRRGPRRPPLERPLDLDLIRFLVRRPGAGAGCCSSAPTGRPTPARGRGRSSPSWPCRPSWCRCRASTEAEVTALVARSPGRDAAARWGGAVHAPQWRASLLRPRAVPGRWPPARTRDSVPPAVRDVDPASARAAVRRLRVAGRAWRRSPARRCSPDLLAAVDGPAAGRGRELARRGGATPASLVR